MKHKNELKHCFLFERKMTCRKIEQDKALYTEKKKTNKQIFT